jgi:type II secretory pathway component PulF
LKSFSYRALTPGKQPISGVLGASDEAEAMIVLRGMGLGDIRVGPVAEEKMVGGAHPTLGGAGSLRGEAFFAFNQQLAQLAGAGLPVEEGLQLVAREMRGGPARRTIEQVTAELSAGKTLSQAIESHRKQFPPLYGRLIDAGIRSGNLQGVLLNMGRHLTLVRRVQSMLWQTLTYPALVLVMFLGVFGFVLMKLIPQLHGILIGPEFRWRAYGGPVRPTPLITQAVSSLSETLAQWGVGPTVEGILLIGAAIGALLWLIGRNPRRREKMVLGLPLIGMVFRRNLIARWCDAVGLGVGAGLDLPDSIVLADDAIGSPALRADGEALGAALAAGRPISEARSGRIIPPLVVAGMETASGRNDLPAAMRSLSQTYEEQAESALDSVNVVLTPVVLVVIGSLVALLMIAVFVPLLNWF